MKSIIMHYKSLEENSDKTYQIQITKQGSGYIVQFQYGRRGGTLQQGVKNQEAVPLEEAERIFDKLVREKTSKGYVPAEGQASAPAMLTKENVGIRTEYPFEDMEEIGMDVAEELVKDDRFLMQVKVDGHYRQAEKLADGTILSFNKKGEAKTFPAKTEAELVKLPLTKFHIVGELVGDSYYPFEMLKRNAVVLAAREYQERFIALNSVCMDLHSPLVTPVSTWWTTKEKQAGLALCKKNRSEGVCFKLKSAPYRAGGGYHFKFKFVKNCTVRILELGRKGHENAVLGLHDGSKWVEVGGASMIGKDKGIKVGSLVEVFFLYATADKRLYQPRIKEVRDDVKESECTFKRQLPKSAYKEGVQAA